jgi:hypothetical protein
MSVCVPLCARTCACASAAYFGSGGKTVFPRLNRKNTENADKNSPPPAGWAQKHRKRSAHTSLLTNPQVRQPITVSDVHVCNTVCRKRRRKSVSSCSANVISWPRPLFMSTNGHTALPLRRRERPTKISISRRNVFPIRG